MGSTWRRSPVHLGSCHPSRANFGVNPWRSGVDLGSILVRSGVDLGSTRGPLGSFWGPCAARSPLAAQLGPPASSGSASVARPSSLGSSAPPRAEPRTWWRIGRSGGMGGSRTPSSAGSARRSSPRRSRHPPPDSSSIIPFTTVEDVAGGDGQRRPTNMLIVTIMVANPRPYCTSIARPSDAGGQCECCVD